MLIFVAENPQSNSYTASLINAYKESGQTVICDPNNFFYSDVIPDILHIHWPERLYQWYPLSEKDDETKIRVILDRLKWYKSNGTIILLTIHDLVLHFSTNRNLEHNIYNLIIENSDIISHHCGKSIELFTKLYPNSKEKINIVNHHGDYLLDYQNLSAKEARAKLNIPEERFVILNFGSQQAYKGREFIEKVFDSVSIETKFLLTAGAFYYRDLSLFKKIIVEYKNDKRVRSNSYNKRYVYRVIDNNEIPFFFNASDIVFLGHRRGLVSGIIAMAATYGKPIVYPEIGCFKEQLEDWISFGFAPDNIVQAANSIKGLYEKLQSKNVNLDNSVWLQKNSWKKHVEIIINNLKKIKQPYKI